MTDVLPTVAFGSSRYFGLFFLLVVTIIRSGGDSVAKQTIPPFFTFLDVGIRIQVIV
jgi:hypothetical protein